MTQSEEEPSTGRMKVGKVRKLPELTAIKLHPGRGQKHLTETNGL
jgi:hypothetical protein